jgi:hypothetical protein
MTRTTTSGCDSITTCEAATSVRDAPACWAIAHTLAVSIAWSRVATTAQEGSDFHAAAVEGSTRVLNDAGRCAAAIVAALSRGGSATKTARNFVGSMYPSAPRAHNCGGHGRRISVGCSSEPPAGVLRSASVCPTSGINAATYTSALTVEWRVALHIIAGEGTCLTAAPGGGCAVRPSADPGAYAPLHASEFVARFDRPLRCKPRTANARRTRRTSRHRAAHISKVAVP